MASLYEDLFYNALRIRLVEERIIALYPSDRIQSPVHLSIGQEAVAVGACRALERTDLLFGSYRSHAFYMAKGGDLRRLFAELYGKVTGDGGGKAGSMHLFAPEAGMMLSSAVVASTIPHAVGAALAARHRGLAQVLVAVFGDGATEEGVYHESLNFASLHGLPVFFLCENNGLAVHSPINARQSYRIAEHARAYGITATHVPEGYDFMGVHDVCARVVGEIRRTRRPQLVVVDTFRYREHVGPGEDYNAGYRTRNALDAWMAKDPLITDTALAKQYLPLIEKEIDDAVEFAERSPWPGRDDLLAAVI